MAHLAWKKGSCCWRAAFHITFQRKTTLSLKTRNRPMNFAMLPKYHIGKICRHTAYRQYLLMKAPTLVFCMSVRKPKLLLRLWLINANSLNCSLRRAALRQSSQYGCLWHNICSQVLCGKENVTCKQGHVVFDYLSDPGLHRIPCYTLLHRTEILSFNCGLSVAKYRHRLAAMKIKNIRIGPKKPYRSRST